LFYIIKYFISFFGIETTGKKKKKKKKKKEKIFNNEKKKKKLIFQLKNLKSFLFILIINQMSISNKIYDGIRSLIREYNLL